eukprot:Nk52_evm2s2612 gene=Nk52_evmTU2s2612
MSSYNDFSSGSSMDNMSMDRKKDLVMDQVRGQLAMSNAQQLLSTMTDKCFKKCVYKPGTSLDSSEKTCIAKCMDRYMEAWTLVQRSYAQRIQKDSEGHSDL